MSTPTGILKRRNASGRNEFFYPVAYDMWRPNTCKDTYVRISPISGVQVVTVTDTQIAHADFTPVHFHGDESDDAQVWLTPETMLSHLQLVALALSQAQTDATEGVRA